jgi:hypothetical protein
MYCAGLVFLFKMNWVHDIVYGSDERELNSWKPRVE